jgi:hypothetical protein
MGFDWQQYDTAFHTRTYQPYDTWPPSPWWTTTYMQRVCHTLNLTTKKFIQGIEDSTIPRREDLL